MDRVIPRSHAVLAKTPLFLSRAARVPTGASELRYFGRTSWWACVCDNIVVRVDETTKLHKKPIRTSRENWTCRRL